jgi:hypothetical protein
MTTYFVTVKPRNQPIDPIVHCEFDSLSRAVRALELLGERYSSIYYLITLIQRS